MSCKVTLFSEQFGQGTPLTMLHGYPLDHTIWLDMVPEMESHVRMILPDLRGHGRSPSPPGKYSMIEMAEDVIRLLDSLSIEKTVVAGHSMGGYVALQLVKSFPDRIMGLALVASHAYADSPEKRESRMRTISQVEKEGVIPVLSSMLEKLSYNKEVVEKCQGLLSNIAIEGVTGVLAGMAERSDSMAFLKNTKFPVIIIAGQEDQVVPIQTSRDINAQLRNPWLVEISGAGHLTMLEKPTQTASALLSFIRSL